MIIGGYNMPANNEARKVILDKLNECMKIAFSGVTSNEYDALKVTRNYIKIFYDRDLIAEKRKDK